MALREVFLDVSEPSTRCLLMIVWECGQLAATLICLKQTNILALAAPKTFEADPFFFQVIVCLCKLHSCCQRSPCLQGHATSEV